MFRLLFIQKPGECDDLSIDVLVSNRRKVAIRSVGPVGGHCREVRRGEEGLSERRGEIKKSSFRSEEVGWSWEVIPSTSGLQEPGANVAIVLAGFYYRQPELLYLFKTAFIVGTAADHRRVLNSYLLKQQYEIMAPPPQIARLG